MIKAKLVIVGGDAKAGEVSLELPTTIGRGKEADLTIPHALVSRTHSKLFERDGQLWVEDLKSLNGTFVDNNRIESEQLIEPNQLLTLGNITFRAVYQVDESARKTLPSTQLPASLQTIKIDPTVEAEADTNHSESESVTEPAPVFEETEQPRSAISEIDSFDPDEIGPLDSMLEKDTPQDTAPQEPASPPEQCPSNQTSSAPTLRTSDTLQKPPKVHKSPPKEAASDLGLADPAALAPVSSVDIDLNLSDNVGAAPVSFLGKIETGDADSPSIIEDFQIILDSDEKPEVDIDSDRLDSFMKKLPK